MPFIDLCIACPVCMSTGINSIREYWTHDRCGGILGINEYAQARCGRCLKQAKITEIKFGCPNNRHVFEVANTNGLVEAFSTSANMVNTAAQSWFSSVLVNISK